MKKLISILIAIFLLYNWGYAQQPNVQLTPKLKFDKSGHIKYIKFDGENKTGKWGSPTSSVAFFKEVLNASEQDQFVLKNKREQKNGSYTEHYKQFYQGVEVDGGIFILQFKNGKLNKANGHYIDTDGIDPLPKLTPDDAAKSYAAYLQIPDVSALKFLHDLVIVEIETISGTDTAYNANLCYKIDLLNSPSSKGETGYVDAHSGKILKTQKNWFNSSATGTFATLYSGTKNAGTQYYGGVYNLIDSSRNAIINTWDMDNAYFDTYSTNADEFTDNDNNWTQQEHSANNDQMALDIHWALQEIYDYFDVEHRLQSFNDSNHMIDAFVHVEFEGNDRDNARFQWFPNGDQVFFFGDGQTIFKPIGALDAVAHEFSHAITHNHTGWANLTTVRRAIHEGFSDIWGVVVENEVAPEKDHWKIGEEVIDVTGDDCLRNIQYPESSTSYTQIADCFGDTRYNDGGNDEAYEKSGVLSYWFYLLSEGGTGINDNNDEYTVYELGLDIAAEIVFDGQTTEFASVSSYADARDAMIDAADDIFGANSFHSLQVANAWYAVGVGSNPEQPTISGPSVVCYSASTFTANNPPNGSSIKWVTSSNLSIQTGGTTATPTIRAKYSSSQGEGWVQVNFISNGYETPGPRQNVWVGIPTNDNIEFGVFQQPPPNDQVPILHGAYIGVGSNTDAMSQGVTGYIWDFMSWSPYIAGYQEYMGYDNGSALIYLTTSAPSQQIVRVSAANTCGSDDLMGKAKMFYAVDPFKLLFSPNPATGETTLTIETNSSEKTFDETGQWDLEVYSELQQLKAKQTNLRGQSAKIQTAGWKEGVYLVRVNYNGEILTGKLVVKR
jgi:Zn-dependent metalloprotease